MGIYANQTLLNLKINTGWDMTDIATATIKYKSEQHDVSGTWAGVIDAPATDGVVSYSGYAGDLAAGKYKVWLYLTDNDGKVIPSSVGVIQFKAEGVT